MLTLWMEADQKRPAAPHFPPPAREHLLPTNLNSLRPLDRLLVPATPFRACTTVRLNNEDQPNVVHIDDGIDISFLGMRLWFHGPCLSRMSRQLPTSYTLQTTPSASHICANELHEVTRPETNIGMKAKYICMLLKPLLASEQASSESILLRTL